MYFAFPADHTDRHGLRRRSCRTLARSAFDAEILLGATCCDPETGDHFVKDQGRVVVSRSNRAKFLQETRLRLKFRAATLYGLDNNRGDVVQTFFDDAKRFFSTVFQGSGCSRRAKTEYLSLPRSSSVSCFHERSTSSKNPVIVSR